MPYFFIIKILRNYNFIVLINSFLKISFNTNLLKLSISNIYLFYYNIYLSFYLFYFDILDDFFIKMLYYILRKSCFLTIFWKFKKLKKFISYKRFNAQFFFYFFKIKKTLYIFNFWIILKKKNILEYSYLLTRKIKQDTTRKEDIAIEKIEDIKKFKYSLRLWDILLSFKFLDSNYLFFSNLSFIIFFKKLKLNGNYLMIQPNYIYYENPYFEFYFDIDRFFLDYMNIKVLYFSYVQIFYFIKTKFILEFEIQTNLLYISFYFENYKWYYFLIDNEFFFNEEQRIIDLNLYISLNENLEENFMYLDTDEEYI